MDTNYETIRSLVELLVKKAGFDLSQNVGEEELEKTKSYIFEFEKKLDDVKEEEKKEVEQAINNFKKIEENWENNAEILGKSILNAYKEKRAFKDVEADLAKLVELAVSDKEEPANESLMSHVYDTIRELEEKQESIEEALSNEDYSDDRSKELDEQTVNYLNSKIIEYEAELKHLTVELERIKNVETKDMATISAIKVYLSNTEKNLERLEEVKKETIKKKVVSTDIWAKLEKAGLEIKRKYSNAKDTLQKFESLLEDMRKSKEEYISRKAFIESEIQKCNAHIEKIERSINSGQYADYANRVLDENKKASIKITLNELKNKKEVIYINVEEVRKEIKKEWSRIDKTVSEDKKINADTEEDNKEIKKPLDDKQNQKSKVEFDW